MCHRKCVYRTETLGCNYAVLNDKTRLAQVYKKLGVNRLTPEAKELLRPRNCPFYEQGKRQRGAKRSITIKSAGVRRHRRVTFNESVAKVLYMKRASDREIGKAVGASTSAIQHWRKRNGLPTFYRVKDEEG